MGQAANSITVSPETAVEEVDLWWGSPAAWASIPSFAAALVLTVGLFVLVRWLVVERWLLQLTFVGLASLLWIGQLLQFGHHYFACSYRLTTRWLYVDRGFLTLKSQRVPVAAICQVEARSPGRWRDFGVGEVWVYTKGPAATTVVLTRLTHPRRVAELIRNAARQARPGIS